MALMKIGILGGTFNPIHIGHLIIAEEAYWRHGLSRVLFIPAGHPPHKDTQDLIEAHHRYEMIKLAIHGNDHFEASDIEITRKSKSYTVDTVEGLLQRLGRNCELYLIIGMDTVQELPSWKDIKRLSTLCRLILVNRPDSPLDSLSQLIPILGEKKVLEMESLQMRIPPIGISSTEIRNRLKAGRQVRYMVPEAVEYYIRTHGLYIKQS